MDNITALFLALYHVRRPTLHVAFLVNGLLECSWNTPVELLYIWGSNWVPGYQLIMLYEWRGVGVSALGVYLKVLF